MACVYVCMPLFWWRLYACALALFGFAHFDWGERIDSNSTWKIRLVLYFLFYYYGIAIKKQSATKISDGNRRQNLSSHRFSRYYSYLLPSFFAFCHFYPLSLLCGAGDNVCRYITLNLKQFVIKLLNSSLLLSFFFVHPFWHKIKEWKKITKWTFPILRSFRNFEFSFSSPSFSYSSCEVCLPWFIFSNFPSSFFSRY